MTVPVRLDACAKHYGATRVLEPIDLEITAGETIVLLGPSGCGKTTTLRLIAGLETPDAGGRVRFGERDVTHLPIERRNVGMVFQSYALFPNMTVAENVGYGLKIRGVPAPERRRRVSEMLEMMRIGDLAGRAIGQLSGGQRQRVALARAIAVEPEVLLLDEPLTALDAKLREALRVEIDRLLRGLGITTVYVTHDQAEAMALGDRIVVMSKGRIAQIGRPRDIWFAPADRFVAEFIGTTSPLPGEIAGGVLTVAGAALAWPGADGPVDVAIRPDAATLVSDAAGPGRLTATVQAAQFLGDRTRLAVALAGDRLLTIDVGAREAPEPGTAVALALDPAALIVLARS
ncbi:ABC transporter ATP-binding protein [Aliidongia dinghuensis]|uniref:ABC transporter ATP-binding protein n=1 Tax=Aliidongia dinghuensis TaxID=1867774 RepID=A0A8J2YTH4_9PROT|nr:ABC transporter ATP-binding protein [Aliidongia dinghuensis]GGF19111.1 ABC transporter ATP-binding protein [Aliidongia dinghuensis]